MIWLLFMFPLMWKSAFPFCGSLQGEKCCEGTYWNETTSRCEKCPLGYYDINCSKSCGFPFYGKDCQSQCNCNYRLCDHKLGCTKFNDTVKSLPQTSYETSVFIRNTTTKLVETKLSKEVSFLQAMQSSIIYIVVTFVAFFGLFASTYFYKHCIKKTPVSNGKAEDPLFDRQEWYNMLHQHIQNNNEPVYLEPVSSVHYEEIDN